MALKLKLKILMLFMVLGSFTLLVPILHIIQISHHNRRITANIRPMQSTQLTKHSSGKLPVVSKSTMPVQASAERTKPQNIFKMNVHASLGAKTRSTSTMTTKVLVGTKPRKTSATTSQFRVGTKARNTSAKISQVSKGTKLRKTSTMSSKAPVVPRHDRCEDPFRQEFVEKQNFLCYIPLSRLGNRMFVHASAFGIAAHLNRTLVIGEDQVAKYFKVTTKIVKDYKCVIRGTKRVLSKLNAAFDGSLMNLPHGNNLCVGKHLQSFKYFEHVRGEIRKQFIFRKEYRDNATKIIDRAIKLYRKRRKISDPSFRPLLVGVHVRRGDMVNHKFGFEVATPEYMDKAAKYFRTKYGRVLFLVCSNDMKWSKKHMKGDDVIYIEGNHFSIDLAVLVSCNHTLSTVGSFSWWAGYLAGGETVYYQWPAREGTEYIKQFSANYTDYFPSRWIGMR